MFLWINIEQFSKNKTYSKLKPNARCRTELSGMVNYPGAIPQGGDCPGVIVLGAIILGEHCGVCNCTGGICLGAIVWGQFLFQVVSPSDTFKTFHIIINYLLPVLIYE